jgi:hypothetical protein
MRFFRVELGRRDWRGGGSLAIPEASGRLQRLQQRPSLQAFQALGSYGCAQGETAFYPGESRTTHNSKLKTLPSRRESPACDLALFFGEEFVPDLWVLGLVAVVLQLRHLATDIN